MKKITSCKTGQKGVKIITEIEEEGKGINLRAISEKLLMRAHLLACRGVASGVAHEIDPATSK